MKTKNKMKTLNKFQAKEIAEFIRSQKNEMEYSEHYARQIENYADKNGMVLYFVVSDTIGGNWMKEVDSKCEMF